MIIYYTCIIIYNPYNGTMNNNAMNNNIIISETNINLLFINNINITETFINSICEISDYYVKKRNMMKQ